MSSKESFRSARSFGSASSSAGETLFSSHSSTISATSTSSSSSSSRRPNAQHRPHRSEQMYNNMAIDSHNYLSEQEGNISNYRSGHSNSSDTRSKSTRSMRSCHSGQTRSVHSYGSRQWQWPQSATSGPQKMTSYERSQRIRNSCTRLQTLCECHRHTYRLDQAGGTEVDLFMVKLHNKLRKFQTYKNKHENQPVEQNHEEVHRENKSQRSKTQKSVLETDIISPSTLHSDTSLSLSQPPEQLSYIASGVHKLQDQVNILLDKLSTISARATSQTTTETDVSRHNNTNNTNITKEMNNAESNTVAIYRDLKLHLLQGVQKELNELHRLLTTPLPELESQVNPHLLTDLVSFHVNEFDAFVEQRLGAFVAEMKDEGVFYSAAVLEDASARAKPIGVSSVVILDVAIGVRPSRCARMTIEHALMNLSKLSNRLEAADVALRLSTNVNAQMNVHGKGAMNVNNNIKNHISDNNTFNATHAQCVEMQKREFSIMRERLRVAVNELTALRHEWKSEERAILERAMSMEQDLELIWQTKKLKEDEVAERAQCIHDATVYVCLPFATPQYYRRYGETYSQPCHVRLGFHFTPSVELNKDDGDHDHQSKIKNTTSNKNTLSSPEWMQGHVQDDSTSSHSTNMDRFTLYTLFPNFLSWMRQRQIPHHLHARYAYLVPSDEEVWINFGELPEMVKGARCALRHVHSRNDHFRALEEQKEVGAYFIMRGGERILRALLMQRCNVALNIERDKFMSQGAHFTSKAVVIRCKRLSGLTVQNYFYYTDNGEIIFSFARKVVWHIPVLLLLSATNTQNVNHLQLYEWLTLGMVHSHNGTDSNSTMEDHHAARVEALLQHHRMKPYSHLTHFLDYITLLGRMYREYHEHSNTFHFLPEYTQGATCQHDAWYGLFMLRRHVLPHLNCTNHVPTPPLPPHTSLKTLNEWLPEPLLRELDRKFDALIAIVRQLHGFVGGSLQHQGNDVPAYQELFTVSQVLTGAFEVCLNRYMKGFVYRLGRHISSSLFRVLLHMHEASHASVDDALRQVRQLIEYCTRRGGSEPLDLMHKLLTTGNMNLDREEDFYCPQTAGWVVMAEHLNFYRFFEQLRCVHRGKTIAEMRSSEVRKYPCEAFGFICMVHSPDGEDCGVLNHLSISTIVSTSMPNTIEPNTSSNEPNWRRAIVLKWIEQVLPSSILHKRTHHASSLVEQLVHTVPLWVEGEVVAYVDTCHASSAAHALRSLKSIHESEMLDVNGIIPRDKLHAWHTLEVVYIPSGSADPAGLYIFYEYGRLMRPVEQIESSEMKRANTSDLLDYSINNMQNNTSSESTTLPFPLVYIGTWEQTWLDVASVPADLTDAVMQLNRKYTYMEQNGYNLLSLTSTTIPFFEYNCSPRNLFQCGLSKQSAGTQLQALGWRKEAKLFRMYYPQRYLSRTLPMDMFELDDVNLGVNAVVAILSYTGYDMDDAVIINSTATQRGMLMAGITVAKIIQASGKGEKNDLFVFQNMLATGEPFTSELDEHGLPYPRANSQLPSFNFHADHSCAGLRNHSDVYCCARRVERVDPLTQTKVYEYTRHHTTKWRHFDKGEDAWVHSVIPLTFDGPDPTSVLMIFRIPRSPNVGDKFSSRHGQKGTLPLHIRDINLPFSAMTGITPDVIINPHAFPSRMTVGMVLEMMTAKIGCIQGRFIDNSAWSIVDDEKPVLAEEVGTMLEQVGFNRFGRELLMDGCSGEEMEAEVFVGVGGYQRLRHMVNDKWQARARTDAHTFRAVTKTGQPVKGRKRHGGVRVGEMERDGLLSHGMSEVVLDRLLHVSDKTKAYICPQCGGLLSIYERHASEYGTWKTCRFCATGSRESTDNIAMIEIPQVLRLWAAELTSIGIRVGLKAEQATNMY